jgi:hypothetical protein
MAKLLRLYTDMSFEEKTVKVSEDKIILRRGETDYTPSFGIGKSVFREKRKISFLMPWKRPRNLIILLDGAPQAISLESTPGENGEPLRPALALNFGTLKDAKRFIYKMVAKSKADQKPITNMQFTVMAILIGAVLVFQFMIMKGVKF